MYKRKFYLQSMGGEESTTKFFSQPWIGKSNKGVKWDF